MTLQRCEQHCCCWDDDYQPNGCPWCDQDARRAENELKVKLAASCLDMFALLEETNPPGWDELKERVLADE